MVRPEGKSPLERYMRRLEENIELDLQEVGWGDLYFIELAQDMDSWQVLINLVMKLLDWVMTC